MGRKGSDQSETPFAQTHFPFGLGPLTPFAIHVEARPSAKKAVLRTRPMDDGNSRRATIDLELIYTEIDRFNPQAALQAPQIPSEKALQNSETLQSAVLLSRSAPPPDLANRTEGSKPRRRSHPRPFFLPGHDRLGYCLSRVFAPCKAAPSGRIGQIHVCLPSNRLNAAAVCP